MTSDIQGFGGVEVIAFAAEVALRGWSGSTRFGKNSGTKSYSRFGRRWRKRGRIDDVHYPLQDRDNGRFVNVQPLFQFLFQSSKLPGQFTLVAQKRSHSQKRADNKDIDSRSPDRSPVSPTGDPVYPTASPHVVFIWTARGLLSTLAAIMAPCSVNA